MSKFSTKFLVLAVIFIVCLITSNFFVPRVWQVGNLPLQLSGAVVLFPVSYIINDCLTEVYGYRKTRLVLWLAFGMSAFVALMSALVCMLPAPMEEGSRQVADNFNSLFMMVPRTTAASLLAFICGSSVNSWVISRMKVQSEGRHFGVRAILSSVAGEMVDSVVFFPLAYWGIMSFEALLSIALMEVTVKTLYEIVALPLTSRIVKRLKASEHEDTYDINISYNPFKLKDI